MLQINNDNTNITTHNDIQKNTKDNFFVLMTLEDEQGLSKQIKIYKNSDPTELAFDFCKANNLDFNSLKFIKSNIKKTKKSFFEKTKNSKDKINTPKNEVGVNEKKEENISTNSSNLEIINEESKNFTESKSNSSIKKNAQNSKKFKKINKRISSNNNCNFEENLNEPAEKIWVSEQINNNIREEDGLPELNKVKNPDEVSSVDFMELGEKYISQKEIDFNTVKNEINSLISKNINSSDIRKTVNIKKNQVNKNTNSNMNNKKKGIVNISKIPQNLKHYKTFNGDKILINNKNNENNKFMNSIQKSCSKEFNKEFEFINKSNYLSPHSVLDVNSKNKEKSNYYQISQNIIPNMEKKSYPINQIKYNSFQKTSVNDTEQKENKKINQRSYQLSEPLNYVFDDNFLMQKSTNNNYQNHYVMTENLINNISNRKILNNRNKYELLNNNIKNIKKLNTFFCCEGNSSNKLKKKHQNCRISSKKTCKNINDSTSLKRELCLSSEDKNDNLKNKLHDINYRGNSDNILNHPFRTLNISNKFNKSNKNDINIRSEFLDIRSHSVFINSPNAKFASPINFLNYNAKNAYRKIQKCTSFVNNEDNVKYPHIEDNKLKYCKVPNKKNLVGIYNVKCDKLKKPQTSKKRNSKTSKTKIMNNTQINQKPNSIENLNKTSKLLPKPVYMKIEDLINYNITSMSDKTKMPKIEKDNYTVKEFYNKKLNKPKKINLENNKNETSFKQKQKFDFEEKIKHILYNLNNNEYFRKNDNTVNILEKIFCLLDVDNDGIVHLNKNNICGYLNILFPDKIKEIFKSIIDLLFAENKKNIITKNGEQILSMDSTSFFNYIFLIIYILSFEG